MKAYPNTIGDTIQKLAGTWNLDALNVVITNVQTVDLTTNSCTVQVITGNAAGTIINNVQLASEQCDGNILIPTVGSTVIIMQPTKSQPYVAMFSEIDGIITATQAGQMVMIGKYWDSGDLKDGEIIMSSSQDELFLLGKPANHDSTVMGVASDQGIQMLGGTSAAVLGDKNVTALTDVYNMITAVQTFATTCSTATLAPQIAAAAATLMTTLTSMLPQYNTDIQATTSTKVTLE